MTTGVRGPRDTAVSIAANLAHVRERIAAACARAGRDPAAVQIVAVSKTQPVAAVLDAIAAGVDAIGENRVQEAAAKRPSVAGATPWHLVGPLQRNKAKTALDLFDLLETLDRSELADRLETLLAPAGRVLPVFLEVNIGGEAQKSGVLPASAAALADHVLERCPHLRLTGVMAVPPYDPAPDRARPHFAGAPPPRRRPRPPRSTRPPRAVDGDERRLRGRGGGGRDAGASGPRPLRGPSC